MKITSQLSIATIALMGLIATGCSQQQVAGGPSQVASGASQVASPSQQVASPSQQSPSQQVASPSQQSPSQQSPSQQSAPPAVIVKPEVVEEEVVIVTPPAPIVPKPMPMPKPRPQSGHVHPAVPNCTDSIRHNHRFTNPAHRHRYVCKDGSRMPVRPKPAVCEPCGRKPAPMKPRQPANRWTHTHPAIPGCTDSIKHTHKFTNARHSHKYECKKGMRPHRPVVRPPVRPVRRPVQPANRWTHVHPAIPGCTDSIRHTHKYTNRNHRHRYECKKGMRPPVRPSVRPTVPPARPTPPPVDVFALQRKLKAKGYYRGPIDGVVGAGTRDALQQYMQNR